MSSVRGAHPAAIRNPRKGKYKQGRLPKAAGAFGIFWLMQQGVSEAGMIFRSHGARQRGQVLAGPLEEFRLSGLVSTMQGRCGSAPQQIEDLGAKFVDEARADAAETPQFGRGLRAVGGDEEE